MSEIELCTVFRPFDQAETTTARDFGGTALGLSLSRSFCHALVAVLRVDSAVGKGTTFRIALRRAA
jgi:signal transduction histidine kinase